MSEKGVATPGLIINNILFPYKPNTIVFTEGLGEYKLRVASLGGSKTERVFTKDVESMFGMIKGTFYTTKENIKEARKLKLNEDTNVVQIVEDGFDRTFNNAAVVNNYEIPAGFEAEFELEFQSDPPV
jgi:hypothetical protein